MQKLSKKNSIIFVLIGLLPAFYLMLTQTYAWLKYEAMGPVCYDASIFIAIGRAMLHGYTPYVDMFENKPPGIFFFIMAASIFLTDSYVLATALDLLILFILPGLFALFAWRHSSHHSDLSYRIFIVTTAALFGTLLAVHSLNLAGQMETEAYGALFGIIYLFIVTSARQMSWKIIGAAALFMMMSIGMKEPFLLTLLASVLLYYCRSLKELLLRFVVPLLLAIDIGIILLWISGLLMPYIHIYAYNMLPEVGNAKRAGSLSWFSGNVLYTFSVYLNELSYSSYYLTYCMGFLFLAACFVAFIAKGSHKSRYTGVAIIVLSIATLFYSVNLRHLLYGHHYAFFIPFYAAAGLMVLRYAGMSRFPQGSVLMLAWFAINCVTLGTHYGTAYDKGVVDFDRNRIQLAKQVATVLDEVMDACKIERYLSLSNIDRPHPMAYTRHIPMGPLPIQLVGYLLPKVGLQQQFLNSLYEARIVLYNTYTPPYFYNLRIDVAELVTDNFSQKLPECAKNVPIGNIHPYRIYFHKELQWQPLQGK